jgi:hypothetical protein
LSCCRIAGSPPIANIFKRDLTVELYGQGLERPCEAMVALLGGSYRGVNFSLTRMILEQDRYLLLIELE